MAGGGETNTANDTAVDDPTTIDEAADLTITKTHTGNFTPGGTGSYTITATNSGATTTNGTVTVTDELPAGLTPTSASASDNSWNCTISGQTLTCTRSDALAAGASYPAITLNVSIAANTSSVTNTVTVAGGGETNSSNNTANDPTTIGTASGSANLLLVKRITRINSTVFTGFVNASNTTDDDDDKWPDRNTYLQGKVDGGVVKPGDEVEYTIYFLSKGSTAAKNVTICDRVPDNTSFIDNAFNSLKTANNYSGTPGADSGIALALDSQTLPTAPTVYLSNIADADRGQFFLAGATPPVACSGSNTNGAVVVNVVTGATTLPNATAPGTPPNSYGFIRFRATVK